MAIDRADLALFVYNVAVVMSGGYVAIVLDIESTLLMGAFAIGGGILWTAYFNISMADRLEEIRAGEYIPDDEDLIETEESEENKPAANDEEDHEGAKPPWEA